MTTTSTTAATASAVSYADLIARLKARQAALGSLGACRSDDERAAFHASYNTIAGWITTLANASTSQSLGRGQ